MPQLAAALILAAGTAIGQTATEPNPREIINGAAEAMKLVFSASYDARLHIRNASHERIVTGRVHLVKLPYSDQIGGQLAVSGEIIESSRPEGESFQAVYDGEIVRRYLSRAQVILEAEPGYGGEELLQGAFGALVLRNLLAVEPYSAEKTTPAVQYLGTRRVDGVRCDLVEARLNAQGTLVRWYLGEEDRLPRKREREFRAATGALVTSTMTLSNLVVNETIDGAVFTVSASDDVRVETMGKAPPKPVNVGDMAPDWTLTGADGTEHSLADYRGKVVVMDFWASWCPHCKRAMPSLQEIHQTYGDDGVEVLAINCREYGNIDPVEFIREKGYTYTVLPDGNSVAPRYRVRGIPAFFVIGPDGRVLLKQTGFNDAKERAMVGVIERALAER